MNNEVNFEIFDLVNTTDEKIKVKRPKINYENALRYRGLGYIEDVNKDIKKTTLYYTNKIGFDLKDKIKEMLTRRNETVLLIANAGGGKTFVNLQVASELVEGNEKNNVVYILAVPTTSQSNQNQVSEDLSKFGFVSIVGKNSKLKNVDDKQSLVDKIKAGNRKFSCVFDKVEELVNESKKKGLEVVLVVDEAHKLIWDTYRKEALEGIDNALNKVDMTIMLTATPRTCMRYYKYDEIFELKDRDAKNNITNFDVLFTDNWELTLRKQIRKIKDAGKVALVRLNNKKLIESLRKSLINQGYLVEVMTSEDKDAYAFKTIERFGMIGADVDVVFCTSVIECGISLKDTDVVPIEIIRDYKDFNSDNTIQFFARPRKTVIGGIMIIKSYQENIKDVMKRYEENKKKNEGKVVSKEVLEAQSKMRASNERMKETSYLRDIDEEVNACYTYMQRALTNSLENSVVYAREYIANELRYRDIHKAIVFDEENLRLKIDKKEIIKRAFKKIDEEIIVKSPMVLETFFKDKIFYGNVTLSFDTEEATKEDKLGVEEAKAERKALVEEAKAKEEVYRTWLEDKNFVKALPDIVEGVVNRANIKNYNLDMSLKEIIEFKNSTLYESIVKCANDFTLDEIVKIFTTKYEVSGKYLEKSVVKELCERNHTIKQIRNGYATNTETKYDTICEVIEHYKQGKKQIYLTDDLKVILHCELVRRKGINNYKHKKTLMLMYDIDPYLYRVEQDWKSFYTKENIKKLEGAISSSNVKNVKLSKSIDSKIVNEVEKIYNIGIKANGNKEYQVINAPHKYFDLDSILNQIKSSK